MKRSALSLVVLLCSSVAAAQEQPTRPKILGIFSVQIQVTDYCKSIDFYSRVLDTPSAYRGPCPPPGQTVTHYGTGFGLRTAQRIDLGSFGTPNPNKLVSEFEFVTDDVPALLLYLKSRGVEAQLAGKFGTIMAIAQDPEGHRLVFMDQKALPREHISPDSTTKPQRIIHVGFVVYDRAAMDHFYKDVLGFRLYWHGGFKDDGEDWYELQVPDGTDWIEYMLNIPADADKKELGIQNHFSLGVKDIHATAEQLRESGITNFDGPEIGRDGKWSLDAYDPDGTRIEFMEFTPVQPPCCHPYTAAHPKP